MRFNFIVVLLSLCCALFVRAEIFRCNTMDKKTAVTLNTSGLLAWISRDYENYDLFCLKIFAQSWSCKTKGQRGFVVNIAHIDQTFDAHLIPYCGQTNYALEPLSCQSVGEDD